MTSLWAPPTVKYFTETMQLGGQARTQLQRMKVARIFNPTHHCMEQMAPITRP